MTAAIMSDLEFARLDVSRMQSTVDALVAAFTAGDYVETERLSASITQYGQRVSLLAEQLASGR